jgi:uncharacterized RDD family membrane protein YckC
LEEPFIKIKNRSTNLTFICYYSITKNKQDTDLSYQTSEKVTVKFALASPYQRIAAYIIDMIFKWLSIMFLAILLVISGVSIDYFFNFSFSAGRIVFIATIIIIAILFFCYNIIFEILQNGQTPGKAIVNIRVIMDDGRFVTFYAVIIRNIFRIIDFLPLYYITGIILIFLTSKNQRVGDITASTIVVCEERIPIPLAERKIMHPCIESYDNLGDIIEENIKNAIKKYITTYKHLAKDVRTDIELKIINNIIMKSGIEKPDTINNYDFIISVYNKILNAK